MLLGLLQFLLCSLCASQFLDNGLYDIDGGGWSTRLGGKNLAILLHYKDSSLCALWSLLEADGSNQGSRGVTEKWVGQLLLSLEGCVCLWTVGAQAVDCKTSLRERLIAVTEETNLGSAWTVLAHGSWKFAVHKKCRALK